MTEFAERVRHALDRAHALGVRRHRASRFEQYVGVLTEAASLSYPRPMMWADVPDKRKLFFEAASQGQQLADAAQFGPPLPRAWGGPKPLNYASHCTSMTEEKGIDDSRHS
jgi:hypothetical protein